MIHIATVHFRSDKWMAIQQRYLRKHIREEYRVYACTPSPALKYSVLYYFSSDFEPRSRRGIRSLAFNKFPMFKKKEPQPNFHAMKLEYLAQRIIQKAEDDDIIVFLDGDAFPISDFVPFIRGKIGRHKLVAIRRDENNGDIQPHPSFCAATVGFWKRINGDWRAGFYWQNRNGELVTDIGGNLLRQLLNVRCDWYPLLRSNRKNPHPLWFGVYGDIIYHHGAGFREPISRYDLLNRMSSIKDEADAVASYKVTPEYQTQLYLMREMFEKIETNDNFYLELIN